jgi:hypothetical protein
MLPDVGGDYILIAQFIGNGLLAAILVTLLIR